MNEEEFKQLQAENATLKAHNRQMVEGAVFAVAHFELNDKDWNPLLCAEYMEFIAPLQKALQTPSAKLARAEAEVLRAAEGLMRKVEAYYVDDDTICDITSDLDYAVEAMQEARKNDH